MLETYDPKWSEKWEVAHAAYAELEAIPPLSRTPEQQKKMTALAHVQTLAFDAQFKTANEMIRFRFDKLYDRQFRSYGEVMACPVLPDDADYDDACEVLRDMASRLEQLQRDADFQD